MRKIFFLLCICFSFNCFGQYWAPTGAVWHYEVQPGLGCFPFCEVNFVKIESVGDTVINGKSSKILIRDSVVDCANIEDTSFTYSDSGKVYWYNKTIDQFTILYDFNTMANNSWKIYVDTCLLTVTVDSITNTIINNDTLKTLYISGTSGMTGGFFSGKILEKIGHSMYMFPYEFNFYCQFKAGCDGEQVSSLRCYEDSIFGFYETAVSSSCDTTYTVSIEDIQNDNSYFSVFPNPCKNNLFLKADFQKNEFLFGASSQYSLYNNIGQLLKEEFIKEYNTIIDISNYSRGIYFLHIIIDNQYINTKKILKL